MPCLSRDELEDWLGSADFRHTFIHAVWEGDYGGEAGEYVLCLRWSEELYPDSSQRTLEKARKQAHEWRNMDSYAGNDFSLHMRCDKIEWTFTLHLQGEIEVEGAYMQAEERAFVYAIAPFINNHFRFAADRPIALAMKSYNLNYAKDALNKNVVADDTPSWKLPEEPASVSLEESKSDEHGFLGYLQRHASWPFWVLSVILVGLVHLVVANAG